MWDFEHKIVHAVNTEQALFYNIVQGGIFEFMLINFHRFYEFD